MSGTKAGGAKCRDTNLKLHGEDYYKRIGSKGGKWCGPKGFALDPERARTAGRKGGLISKRGKAKPKEYNITHLSPSYKNKKPNGALMLQEILKEKE